MTKLVVLKLEEGDLSLEEGDLSKGVKVWLEIGEEGDRASIEMTGFLPATDLLQIYNQWQNGYLRLGRATSRLTHIATIIDGDITPEKCRENAELVRSRLNEWLRSPSFMPLREKCLQELNPNEEVRVLIRTNSESLRKLPWQLWDLIEGYPLAEVALSATEHEQLVFNNRPANQKRIKILAILGDSTGINVNEDRQVLENLPDTDTTFLVEPQLEKINDSLWEHSWDILCFAGHSRSEGKTGRIYINKTDSLTIDELKQGLEKAVRNGLQLAIFNSCDGLGLASVLQGLKIPQLIVMREPVPDQVAQRYLKYLLHAFIIKGEKLYLAHRIARKRLEGLEKDFPCAGWLPVIFQHPTTVVPLTRDRLLHNRRDYSIFSSRYILGATIITLVIVLAFGAAFFGKQPQSREEWGYSDFLGAVRRGMISQVSLSPDRSKALVKTLDGDLTIVTLIKDRDLINALIHQGIDISVLPIESIVHFNRNTLEDDFGNPNYMSYGDLIQSIKHDEVNKVELNEAQEIAKVYLKEQKPGTLPLQVKLLENNSELIEELKNSKVSFESVP